MYIYSCEKKCKENVNNTFFFKHLVIATAFVSKIIFVSLQSTTPQDPFGNNSQFYAFISVGFEKKKVL